MGIFDKLFGNQSQSSSGNTCPACGSMAMSVAGKTLCSNPSCKNFAGNAASSFFGSSKPASSAPLNSRASGSFSPLKPIVIQYTNFRGEPKSFTSDASTLVRHKTHISAQVAPSGERITLARSRINNLSEIESSFKQPVAPGQDWPSARERQVLNYHKKYGSTSPLHEKIRAKYPNW